MNITKQINGKELTIALEGKLDTTTAPELEQELEKSLDGVDKLVFDLKDMDYISSAGLRVLLSAHKKMIGKNGMLLKNVCEEIMEIFEVTGFIDMFQVGE
ncbi:MAG: STAS domain-containing protein [Lachnospiraceae bacterium]|nr:STAS domain-containing protein [Lachnospiraceae bacterium]MBQ8116460.1 STAS domain-containing protein [Lachnospiraceae bacterium]